MKRKEKKKEGKKTKKNNFFPLPILPQIVTFQDFVDHLRQITRRCSWYYNHCCNRDAYSLYLI